MLEAQGFTEFAVLAKQRARGIGPGAVQSLISIILDAVRRGGIFCPCWSSQESRIALSSFRLLVTFVVVLAALKYGISTYFPPARKVGSSV